MLCPTTHWHHPICPLFNHPLSLAKTHRPGSPRSGLRKEAPLVWWWYLGLSRAGIGAVTCSHAEVSIPGWLWWKIGWNEWYGAPWFKNPLYHWGKKHPATSSYELGLGFWPPLCYERIFDSHVWLRLCGFMLQRREIWTYLNQESMEKLLVFIIHWAGATNNDTLPTRQSDEIGISMLKYGSINRRQGTLISKCSRQKDVM